MKIIGHRGIPSYSPENSLISLDYLKKFKYKWIETDVILTKYNITIILHDNKLDSDSLNIIQNNEKLKEEFTAMIVNELKELDASDKNHKINMRRNDERRKQLNSILNDYRTSTFLIIYKNNPEKYKYKDAHKNGLERQIKFIKERIDKIYTERGAEEEEEDEEEEE